VTSNDAQEVARVFSQLRASFEMDPGLTEARSPNVQFFYFQPASTWQYGLSGAWTFVHR
jgi:hypothetical protein